MLKPLCNLLCTYFFLQARHKFIRTRRHVSNLSRLNLSARQFVSRAAPCNLTTNARFSSTIFQSKRDPCAPNSSYSVTPGWNERGKLETRIRGWETRREYGALCDFELGTFPKNAILVKQRAEFVEKCNVFKIIRVLTSFKRAFYIYRCGKHVGRKGPRFIRFHAVKFLREHINTINLEAGRSTAISTCKIAIAFT